MKNVIFDFGKVMVDVNSEYMIRHFVTDEDDIRLLAEKIFDQDVWEENDKGDLSMDEFMQSILPGIPERLHEKTKEILSGWFYYMPEIEGMRALIGALKEKGKKVYLLSNICKQFVENRDKIPILEVFDGTLFSCEIHKIKPCREIYMSLLEKYHLKAEECVFIDDRAVNIEGAEACGIKGYVFDGDVKRLSEYLFK